MKEYHLAQIEQMAQEALRRANLLTAPVDVEKVASVHGVRVHVEPLDDQVSGVLIVKGEERHILVNSAHHENRRRFSIAHELGHLILHHNQGSDRMFIDHQIRVYQRVGEASADVYRAPDSTTTPEEERDANSFAACLLMPAPLVTNAALERDMWDELDVAALARAFAVSEQAMSIRLLQLRVVRVPGLADVMSEKALQPKRVLPANN